MFKFPYNWFENILLGNSLIKREIMLKILKNLRLNNNKNITHQNLWDVQFYCPVFECRFYIGQLDEYFYFAPQIFYIYADFSGYRTY